jgi:hypothetical protein
MNDGRGLFGENVTIWTKEQLDTAKEKYGEYCWHWYFWCLEHWGNLWDDIHTTINEHDDIHINMYFETPDAPIIEGLLQISKDCPLLTFSVRYKYEYCDYPGGEVKIKGGKILSKWEESEEERMKSLYALYCGS